MTTLDLTDGSDEWRLYNVQVSGDPTEASADTFNGPGIASDQTFISVLSEAETFELTGLVTAPQLAGTSSPNSYSSDWFTALSEYAQRAEAFAHASQGTGYTLQDRDRSRTSLNVIIEDVTWTLEKEAVYQLSYEVTCRRGNGLLPSGSVSVGSATPGSKTSAPTLGGESLDGFERLELSKTLPELDVFERAFASDAGSNDIVAQQGPVRTWEYRGTYAGSNSARNSFDDTIRGFIDDSTHTFSTIFPGYSPSVFVLSYESTRKAEHGASMHEYSITMREGQ